MSTNLLCTYTQARQFALVKNQSKIDENNSRKEKWLIASDTMETIMQDLPEERQSLFQDNIFG